jgi:hypothetical protein
LILVNIPIQGHAPFVFGSMPDLIHEGLGRPQPQLLRRLDGIRDCHQIDRGSALEAERGGDNDRNA